MIRGPLQTIPAAALIGMDGPLGGGAASGHDLRDHQKTHYALPRALPLCQLAVIPLNELRLSRGDNNRPVCAWFDELPDEWRAPLGV